jgi:glycosyltransferase involved in cell wall biosynthesis
MRMPTGIEYRFFANGSLPTPEMTLGDRALQTVPIPTEGSGTYNEILMKSALLGADVDGVFLPSPMELLDAALPDLGDFPGNRYAICYDLVPFLYADIYLTNATLRSWYTRRLRNIRNADFVFAISESTRQDSILHLGIPGDRVINIGAGVSSFFRPESPEETIAWRARFAEKFAIDRPFVLYTGGEDWRKNIEGLVTAFAMIPADLRRDFQLVVACKMTAWGGEKLKKQAADLGLPADAIVLTGFVTDEELRALYSLCELFVFPSVYEGFGLPIVEAMACGAPAITGDNSSLKEIVTSPELLFDSRSPTSIASRLESVLRNDSLRARLRLEAPAYAAGFTWDAVAEKVHAVLEQAPSRPAHSFALARYRKEGEVATVAKPTLAFFSPLRPQRSGISDYSEELMPALGEYYNLDLYVDDGYSPLPESTQGRRLHRGGMFDSIVSMRRQDYRSALYQMGNNVIHGYMYALLRRFTGITVLHDYALCGMIRHVEQTRPYLGIRLRDELSHSYGRERADEILSEITRGKVSIGDLPAMGVYGNRRIFTRSVGVIVHNRWAYDQAVKDHGNDCEHIALIPMLVLPVSLDALPDEKQRLRRKWDVPEDATVFASFGFISESKRPFAVLDAFRRLLAEQPEVFLIFVGAIELTEDFNAEIAKRGLNDRVRVTGFVADIAAFNELLRLTDVCVALRYPSNGETSAALMRILIHGKPAIVTDIGSFAEFPDDVVHKLPTPDQGDEVGRLAAAFHLLATDTDYRDGLGRRAVAYMQREHAPEHCARLYRDFIETVMDDPRTRPRLLADYAARELAKIGSSDDPAALLAPFQSIFAPQG